MKRTILILFAIGMAAMSSTSMAAMSNSRIRKETRFLTDKMAYELSLNTEQYNDAYEINFDFIYSVRYLMDDVVSGYEWALDDYYQVLDVRNDDLRWVLSDSQYRRFLRVDYFYRPIYASGRNWNFRIYITYTNHNHFYFGRPYHYRTYCGGHHRAQRNNGSYYRGRYNHSFYSGSHSVRDDKVYRTNRRSDFGSVSIRPNTSTRPSRSTSNSSSGREGATTNRESGSSRRSGSSSESRREITTPRTDTNSSSGRRSGSSDSRRETTNPSSNSSSDSSSRRSNRSSASSEKSEARSSSDSSSSSESRRSNSSSSSSRSSRSPEKSNESSRK